MEIINHGRAHLSNVRTRAHKISVWPAIGRLSFALVFPRGRGERMSSGIVESAIALARGDALGEIANPQAGARK